MPCQPLPLTVSSKRNPPLKWNLLMTGNLRCFKLYRTHVKINDQPNSLAGHLLIMGKLFFYQFKIFLGNTAERARPIIWNSFERSAWSDTAIWVTYYWVINPITYCANILFHNSIYLVVIILFFSDAKIGKIRFYSNK